MDTIHRYLLRVSVSRDATRPELEAMIETTRLAVDRMNRMNEIAAPNSELMMMKVMVKQWGETPGGQRRRRPKTRRRRENGQQRRRSRNRPRQHHCHREQEELRKDWAQLQKSQDIIKRDPRIIAKGLGQVTEEPGLSPKRRTSYRNARN